MNDTTIYRLYIALELMKEGLTASTAPGPIGPMRAVLSLDHAVELTLRTLLPLVGESPKPADSLADLLKHLFNVKSSLVSHRAAMLSMRSIRNGVQHDGTITSEAQARIVARDAENFLRSMIHEVLHRTLEEITLVDLVRNERAKSLLRTAEKKIAEAQYDDACIDIATGFTWASGRMIDALVGTRHERDLTAQLFDRIERAVQTAAAQVHQPGFTEFGHQFRRALSSEGFSARGLFEPLQRFALFSSLGISPLDVRRFVKLMPAVDFSRDGTEHVMIRRQEPASRETASFALQFATNAILSMQAWYEEEAEKG